MIALSLARKGSSDVFRAAEQGRVERGCSCSLTSSSWRTWRAREEREALGKALLGQALLGQAQE